MKPSRLNPLTSGLFRRSYLTAFVVTLTGFATMADSNAQSISVNFGAGNAVNEAGKLTGAVPVAGNRWNNPAGNNGTNVSLLDSAGNSTATATWTSANIWNSASTGATATSENGDLTKNYLDDGGAGPVITLNSPYLLNDVYVIPATDGTAGFSPVSINGNFYRGNTGSTVATTSGGAVWGLGAPWSASDTLVEGTNFVKALAQPGVVIRSLGSSAGRASLAGVQVVNAYSGTLSYWDANGTAAGSGNTGGTWGSDSFWTATANGTGTPSAWVNGNAAVFSAGSDGVSPITINITGTQSADAVWAKGGDITLTGGTLNLTGTALLRGDDSDASSYGLIIESAINATDLTVAGIVDFASASNSITGNVTTSGTSVVVADQSWNRISGPGTIQVLSPAILTLGATNLDSTFSGTFTGDGQVLKSGTGNLTLTAGSASYTGTFEVVNGTLTFSNAAGAYNTGLALTGAGNLAFAGTGNSDPTITASGNNSGFTGPVSVSGVRVGVDNANDLGTGSVTVVSGGQVWATGGAIIPNAFFLNGNGTTEAAGNLGAVRFDGGAALGGTVTLQSNSRLTAWTGATGAVTGALVGAFDLEKTGTGTVTIASTGNTGFTGKAISSEGVLRIAAQTSLGTTPASPVADSIILRTGGLLQGGTAAAGANVSLDANRGIYLASGNGGFQVWTGFTMTVNGAVTGPGNLVKGDGGTLVANGAVNVAGSLTSNSGTQTFNGNMTLGGSFNVGTNIVTNLNCPIFSAGGAGTDGMKFFTGTTNINIGTGTASDLEMGNSSNQAHTINHSAGSLSITNDIRIGHWGGATSVYNISGGSLNQPDTVTDTGAEGQANLMLGIDGSGILNVSGSGVVNTSSLVVNGRNNGSNAGQDALNLTGGRLNLGKWGMRTQGTTYAVNLGGGTMGASADWSSSLNMALTGTGGNTTFNTLDSVNALSTRTITLSGVLSGVGGLVKQGAGILNLTNENNSFTGTTQVDEGTLFLRNKAATPINSLVLSGGILNPGSQGTSAAINAVSTQFDGGIARFRIGSGVDRVNTTDFNATSATTIEVSPVGDLTVGAEYPVIDYSGTATGLGNLTLTPLPNPRYGISLVDDVANKSINVKINVIDSLIWTGATNTTWNAADSNWKLVSSDAPTTFLALDKVLFDGATPGTITLNGALEAGQVTVNATVDYTFAGTGGLSGNASIQKSGTGTLTLTNPNNHLGGNSVSGGLLVVGASNALGAAGNVTQVGAAGILDLSGQNLESSSQSIRSAGNIVNSSTTIGVMPNLELTGNTTINSANSVHVGSFTGASGSLNLAGNTLIKEGSGELVLNGVSVTTGNITINGGSVRLIRNYNNGNQRAVSLTSTGNLTINSGATLITNHWSPGLTMTMPIVLNGGTFGSDWPGPNGVTIASPINVTADSFMNFGGGYGNVTFSGVISGTGKVTRTGGETLTLTGTNTNSGGFVINSGNIQVGNGGTTGNLGTGPVTNNTTLTFNRSNALSAPNAIGGTGLLVKNGTGTLTLSGVSTYTGNTTINTGTLTIADGGKLNFKPVANGVSNKVGGVGAFTVAGDFTVDLSTADTTTGNSWRLVDVDALAFESFASTFSIDGFTEDGETGIHTRVAGSSTWTFDESTGLLGVVTITDPYAAWETANGIEGAGATADSDGDGIPNGIEFVIGGDPSGPGSDSNGLLPTLTVSGGYLNFNFRRTDESAVFDPVAEYSSSLAGWTIAEAGVNGVIINEVDDGFGTGIDSVTVRIPIGLAIDEKLFARLKVDFTP